MPSAPAVRALVLCLTLAGPSIGALPASDRANDPSAKPPASMRDPGPDLGGDFPNGAGVVPSGRLYLETGVTYDYTASSRTEQLGAGFLIRVGIVPRFELRFSGGLGFVDEAGDETTGVVPLQVGFKYHFVEAGVESHRPAVGFEFQAVLPSASAGLDDGVVEPSASFNLDHQLPADFSFHWNLGFCTSVDDDGDLFAQGDLQWSVAKDVSRDFSVYVTGFAVYPASKPGGGTDAVAGAGFQWYPNDRTSFEVTLSTGLTEESPDRCAQVVAAFAF